MLIIRECYMNKLIYTIVLIVVCVFSAYGQNTMQPTIGYGAGYTVTLKNGKSIRGKMVSVNGDRVRVFLDDMGVWREYLMSRVEKIELDKEWGKLPDENEWAHLDSVPRGRSRIYANAGYAHWFNANHYDDRQNSIMVDFAYGYQFNPHVFLGFGLGFDCSTNNETVYMPILVNLRIDLSRSYTTPFLDVKTGYSIDIGELSGAGVFLKPSVGVRFFPGHGKRWPFNASLGFVLQNDRMLNKTLYGVNLSIGTAF